MKSIIRLCRFLLGAALMCGPSSSYALVANDSGSNYSPGTWTNGANRGTGFGAWVFDTSAGTGGNAGAFIGNPASANITGMATNSFALYAKPSGSGALQGAGRQFSSAMAVGDTFSFQWGINFDSGVGGAKGFNIYTGAIGVNQIINVNNGSNSIITFNGSNVGFGYGNQVMNWSFTLTTATTLSVLASARNGVGSFSTNLTVSTAPLSFRFYAYQLDDALFAAEREPYFNNLNVVPEPSTYALLGLSAAGLAGYGARRRARDLFGFTIMEADV